ncbi:hypothetical protein TRV_04018 [Trichophyton verrucosum HKI 0517]|uniref:Uncharacterized protein n=1 Tax=Trichophyton verrucosum (strain HKI 0517) TaxID=663202 RepID=D4DA72_TRIVH|nr:uncharacterized protein TRV_04018 [Trichophyton verrucosum HKI 0517]EFE41223.1 hypothetical protein TRV_04018 [Trichophyton verrucosum HKI 0517]
MGGWSVVVRAGVYGPRRAARSLDVERQEEEEEDRFDAIEDEGREGGSRGTKETNKGFRLLRRGRIKGRPEGGRQGDEQRRPERRTRRDREETARRDQREREREREKSKRARRRRKRQEDSQREREEEAHQRCLMVWSELSQARRGQSEGGCRQWAKTIRGQEKATMNLSGHAHTEDTEQGGPRETTARQKEAKETVEKWLISANIKLWPPCAVLPWGLLRRTHTTLVTDMSVLAHSTQHFYLRSRAPKKGGGKEKSRFQTGEVQRQRGRIQQIQKRYDTSSKGRCLAHRHQPGPPFLPPPANRPLLRPCSPLAWSTPHSHTP